MKAKAVLFMILMVAISFTGFANHSDPGQNSKPVLITDSGVTANYDLQVMDFAPEIVAISTNHFQGIFEVIGQTIVIDDISVNGDSLKKPPKCFNKSINSGILVGTDTIQLKNKTYYLYRYLYKDRLVIVAVPALIQKARDKLLSK